jgi:hypothetical protein
MTAANPHQDHPYLQLEPREPNDGDFPPHMLLWAVVGTIAYFGVIAAAMILAAVAAR